ncbi:MAG: hypothetical protein RL172_2356 [Bacteroidota bacterium]|jgi:hypothetical protein
MKNFIFLFVSFVLYQADATAKIRRVGFFASPTAGTDYTTFAAAYTAAVANDTILMFPNNEVNGTLAKKLTIIGPGNWLDANSTPKGNANLQAFAGIATVNTLILNPGCEGTVIMGMYGGVYYLNASDITLKRNRDIFVYITASNTPNTVSNFQALQNYRLRIQNYYANNSSCTNMNISNNLINLFSTAAGNTYNGNIANNVWAYDVTQTANALNGGASTLSDNNSIELGAGAYLLQNNIFASYTNATATSNYNYYYFSNAGNSIFNYNMALQAGSGVAQTWGTGTGNVITPIANAANIFTAFPLIGTSSADARYQLKAGSPALTAGAGNTAIGMFAGAYPYKLSTIPTIPTIYALSSPQGNNPPGNSIQINVSARGNN